METNSLTKATKTTRVMNGVAAGTSDQNSSSVDMQNFEGVEFTALFGTLTATQVTTVKLQTSSDDSNWNDLLGSQSSALADDDDDQCLIVELIKPRERYIRLVVERGTANAVIDGVVAKQWGPRTYPTTQDATTVSSSEVLVSVAEGTA